MSAKKNIRALVETAVLVALAFALSFVTPFRRLMPQGGSVTVASMLPILLIGMRHGLPWGLGGAAAYSLLQALQEGALAPPASGLSTYALMLLLDYLLAFGALGLSALFRRMKYGLIIAAPVCLTLRYVCHVASGVILWGSYAWEGWGALAYSLAYNATYMLPEIVITTGVALLLYKTVPKKYMTGAN